uniref:Uncharacterized protein n=1 Tax=Anguilla anguilla TaxID=7936 RepID=A0A0E9U300_ANGAN
MFAFSNVFNLCFQGNHLHVNKDTIHCGTEISTIIA